MLQGTFQKLNIAVLFTVPLFRFVVRVMARLAQGFNIIHGAKSQVDSIDFMMPSKECSPTAFNTTKSVSGECLFPQVFPVSGLKIFEVLVLAL